MDQTEREQIAREMNKSEKLVEFAMDKATEIEASNFAVCMFTMSMIHAVQEICPEHFLKAQQTIGVKVTMEKLN